MLRHCSSRRLLRHATGLGIQQRRFLNLHEYQSAQIMADGGVTVPLGYPATTVVEAVAAAAMIGDDEVLSSPDAKEGVRRRRAWTLRLQAWVSKRRGSLTSGLDSRTTAAPSPRAART